MALNAAFPYYNLRNLSQLFKDNLANPLLCKLLEGKNIVEYIYQNHSILLESGQRSSATLIGLPNEIKVT